MHNTQWSGENKIKTGLNKEPTLTIYLYRDCKFKSKLMIIKVVWKWIFLKFLIDRSGGK